MADLSPVELSAFSKGIWSSWRAVASYCKMDETTEYCNGAFGLTKAMIEGQMPLKTVLGAMQTVEFPNRRDSATGFRVEMEARIRTLVFSCIQGSRGNQLARPITAQAIRPPAFPVLRLSARGFPSPKSSTPRCTITERPRMLRGPRTLREWSV